MIFWFVLFFLCCSCGENLPSCAISSWPYIKRGHPLAVVRAPTSATGHLRAPASYSYDLVCSSVRFLWHSASLVRNQTLVVCKCSAVKTICTSLGRQLNLVAASGSCCCPWRAARNGGAPVAPALRAEEGQLGQAALGGGHRGRGRRAGSVGGVRCVRALGEPGPPSGARRRAGSAMPWLWRAGRAFIPYPQPPKGNRPSGPAQRRAGCMISWLQR